MTSSSTSANGIKHIPPPWTLRGTIYTLLICTTSSSATSLSSHSSFLYSPLERSSSFSSPANGKLIGGLGMIQIIRYTSSPVGPYDEMVVIPGKFEYEKDGKKRRNLKVTRIYVSQESTCWNGRKSEFPIPISRVISREGWEN